MKTIMALLFLVSCATSSRTYDYMIGLPDGTYICDDFVEAQKEMDVYGNCEHVLYGNKVSTIHVTRNTKVTYIVEEAK